MQDLSQTTVKGYELRERIGEGGFGAVYRAYQPLVGREVAIKVVLPQYANHPDFIRRFEVEAQLVARLEHFHIVALYDFWRDPTGAYIVMRWLRGGSLNDRLERGFVPLVEASHLLDQIASALSVAHRHGIVHRDIKPANILLDEDGNAYLADFGIAKDLTNAEDAIPKDAIAGSPAYISPEQIQGSAITPSADIYSLGILMYELVTGTHPFVGDTHIELLYKHIEDTIPVITHQDGNTPHPISAVLQRATAKNPEERFPDVLTFAAAFRQAIILNADASTNAERTVGTTGLSTALLEGETVIEGLYLPEMENPFKGLRPFEEADASDFYGREALVNRLVQRMTQAVNASRFLAVVGPSGSGKSSVVKAGLIPRLRDDAIPGSKNWFVVEMFPGSHPLEEIEAALLRIAVSSPDTLLSELKADANNLHRILNDVLPDDDTEMLLFIDQFEEVFTMVDDEAERLQFLKMLTAAVLAQGSRLRVIITLRADFYDRPLLYADFGRLVRLRTEVVLPLTPEELEQAIIEPATRVGLRVEAGLVPAIISDVNAQPGALPLLQYALTELFERRSGDLMTLASYQEIGGAMGALARRADELYDKLDAQQREAARQLFLRLVTLGEGTEDTRRRVMQAELLSMQGVALNDVIELFGKYRLLTFDNDPVTRSPTIEIAHEALIREWQRMRGWLEDARDDVRLQRRLAVATEDWLEAGRDASFLASGARLQQFEEWINTTDLALSQDEVAYYNASIQGRLERLQREEAQRALQAELERRSRNRLRALVGVLLVSTIIAVVLAVVAFTQFQNAEDNADAAEQSAMIAARNATEAQSIALAASAQQLARDDNFDLAVALALEANAIESPPAQVQRVLAEVAYAPGTRHNLVGHSGWIYNVAFSPDDATALSGSIDGNLILWDTVTGAEIRRFVGNADVPVFSVAYSPDGRVAVSGNGDDLIFWDIATGEQLRQIPGEHGSILSIAFTPDGERILTGTADGSLILRDVANGAIVHQFGDGLGSVYSVAFSPDGAMALTGTADSNLFLWNIEDAEQIRRFTGHTDQISSVAFSPDGRLALSGSWDNTIRLWNVRTGVEVRRFTGHLDVVSSIAFSPDGATALSSSADGTIRLWDIESGEELNRFTGHAASVNSAIFNAVGDRIFSGAADGSLRLWDAASGAQLSRLDAHRSPVIDTTMAAGNISLSASSGGMWVVWDTTTGAIINRFDEDSDITSAALSPDAQLVAVGLEDGTVVIRDARVGNIAHRIPAHINNVLALAFSPDGQMLASGGRDLSLKLWDVDTGDMIRQFAGHSGSIHSIRFSSDSRQMISGSRDRTAILWDVTTGEEVRRFSGHGDSVLSADLSGDGQFVVTASLDTTVRLWDAATGEEVRRFVGHIGPVEAVAFSPDGTSLLSAGEDRIIRLWDVDSGVLLREFTGHTDTIHSISFAADGASALTGSADTTVRQWQITSLDELIAWTTANRYVRELTCTEREQFRVQPLCDETN